jgi:hypothetical protein
MVDRYVFGDFVQTPVGGEPVEVIIMAKVDGKWTSLRQDEGGLSFPPYFPPNFVTKTLGVFRMAMTVEYTKDGPIVKIIAGSKGDRSLGVNTSTGAVEFVPGNEPFPFSIEGSIENVGLPIFAGQVYKSFGLFYSKTLTAWTEDKKSAGTPGEDGGLPTDGNPDYTPTHDGDLISEFIIVPVSVMEPRKCTFTTANLAVDAYRVSDANNTILFSDNPSVCNNLSISKITSERCGTGKKYGTCVTDSDKYVCLTNKLGLPECQNTSPGAVETFFQKYKTWIITAIVVCVVFVAYIIFKINKSSKGQQARKTVEVFRKQAIKFL